MCHSIGLTRLLIVTIKLAPVHQQHRDQFMRVPVLRCLSPASYGVWSSTHCWRFPQSSLHFTLVNEIDKLNLIRLTLLSSPTTTTDLAAHRVQRRRRAGVIAVDSSAAVSNNNNNNNAQPTERYQVLVDYYNNCKVITNRLLQTFTSPTAKALSAPPPPPPACTSKQWKVPRARNQNDDDGGHQGAAVRRRKWYGWLSSHGVFLFSCEWYHHGSVNTCW